VAGAPRKQDPLATAHDRPNGANMAVFRASDEGEGCGVNDALMPRRGVGTEPAGLAAKNDEDLDSR